MKKLTRAHIHGVLPPRTHTCSYSTPRTHQHEKKNGGLDCGYHALINYALNQTCLKSLWWKYMRIETCCENCDRGGTKFDVRAKMDLHQFSSTWEGLVHCELARCTTKFNFSWDELRVK